MDLCQCMKSHAHWYPHINQRSAGSRIAASLHQGLNINVRGQISSRGNPFKSILFAGWCFWLIYANLNNRFMLILCFNLNQCVRSGLKASINLTVSVHLALSLCLLVYWYLAETVFWLTSPFTVPILPCEIGSVLGIICFSSCFTCPEGGSSEKKFNGLLPKTFIHSESKPQHPINFFDLQLV